MFSRYSKQYIFAFAVIINSLFFFSCNSNSNNFDSDNYIILISFDGFRWDYMDKTDMVKDISRIGKQPDSFMDIATDIQVKSERFQQNLIIGLAKIMDAGAKLDIKAEELTKKSFNRSV